MLDVIHVIFEDDILPRWEQDITVKDEARKTIYGQMYGRPYKYGQASAQGREAEFGSSMYDAPPDGSIKPYIPPTDPQELVNILGAPME